MLQRRTVQHPKGDSRQEQRRPPGDHTIDEILHVNSGVRGSCGVVRLLRREYLLNPLLTLDVAVSTKVDELDDVTCAATLNAKTTVRRISIPVNKMGLVPRKVKPPRIIRRKCDPCEVHHERRHRVQVQIIELFKCEGNRDKGYFSSLINLSFAVLQPNDGLATPQYIRWGCRGRRAKPYL